MTSRVLGSVAVNFLGTYLSRYSDYQGYWLFGFLVPALTELRVDLLNPPADDRKPFQFAVDLAVQRFREQVQKSRLEAERVTGAQLTLACNRTGLAVEVNGHQATGAAVLASIVVESSGGRRFKVEQSIVVAPHSPLAELRSARVA